MLRIKPWLKNSKPSPLPMLVCVGTYEHALYGWELDFDEHGKFIKSSVPFQVLDIFGRLLLPCQFTMATSSA